MSREIDHLLVSLKESFSGNPWHGGGSLIKKLNAMDHTKVNAISPCSNNSVAKLVAHLIQWKVFTSKKLLGDPDFDIKLNSKDDWPEVHVKSEPEWQKLIDKLADAQAQLLHHLTGFSPELLDTTIPGEKYSYRYLLEGIIQHDVYHLAQIILIYNTVSTA